MIIDFSKIDEKIIPEFKGGKKDTAAKMYVDELGKIMKGRLVPGASIGMHTHDTSSEIIYILSGKADFLFDDKTEEAAAGSCHYCPKGHRHSMINNGNEDLIFFAVVPEQ
jgi:quercetin dioxygenase-like cupin family protein